MRIRPPLLLFASLAALPMSGCAALRRPNATAGQVESAQASGPGDDASASSGGQDTNPAEVSDHSSNVGGASAAPVSALSRPEVQTMITGVALTSAGAFSAVMGGVFLGWGGGFCHSYNDSCSEGVALPVVGALWIGASVLPLVLGVSLWVPKTKAPSSAPGTSPSRPAQAARPAIIVGPAGAGVRLSF